MRHLFPVLCLLFLFLPACDTGTDEPEGIQFGLLVNGTEGLEVSCTITLTSDLGEVTERFDQIFVPNGANLGFADVVFVTCRKQDDEGELVLQLQANNETFVTESTTASFGSVSVAFP